VQALAQASWSRPVRLVGPDAASGRFGEKLLGKAGHQPATKIASIPAALAFRLAAERHHAQRLASGINGQDLTCVGYVQDHGVVGEVKDFQSVGAGDCQGRAVPARNAGPNSAFVKHLCPGVNRVCPLRAMVRAGFSDTTVVPDLKTCAAMPPAEPLK
jgi:hypothetical protein